MAAAAAGDGKAGGPSADSRDQQQLLQQAALDPTFELLGEEVVYQRYLTLFNRSIRFPSLVPGQVMGIDT